MTPSRGSSIVSDQSTQLPELMNNAIFLQQEAAQQKNAIHNIVRYAIIISLFYALFYSFMSFTLLASFNVLLYLVYTPFRRERSFALKRVLH